MHVCFDDDQRKARELAHEIWPVAGLPGQLFSELPLPSLFEKASKLVTADRVAELIPCGPDPEIHLRAIREYLEAGFDHIFIHQIGPNQKQFMDFYAREIFPPHFRIPDKAWVASGVTCRLPSVIEPGNYFGAEALHLGLFLEYRV